MKEFIERLKITYRPIFEKAIEYEQISLTEMIIKCDDGSVYLYETLGDTIRSMPRDSNMSKDRFTIEVGERIRRIMDKRKITQEMLSKMTGISQTVLSRYILGKSTPGLYAADKISRALNCSVSDFLYRYWERGRDEEKE